MAFADRTGQRLGRTNVTTARYVLVALLVQEGPEVEKRARADANGNTENGGGLGEGTPPTDRK